MKKLAIISTGLLLGFFVFLTGFPTVATAGHKVLECDETCKAALPLNAGQLQLAEVLLVLGQGNRVIVISLPGHEVRPDDSPPRHNTIQHPTPHPDSGDRSTIIFQPRTTSGCVTINGRTYCW